MSRESMILTLQTQARNLGWTEVEAEDAGTEVRLLVSAPDATEQMVEGTLHKIPSLLKVLGGPEGYPAVEEYDADPTPQAELASEVAEMAEYAAKKAASAAEALHEDVEKPGLGDFGRSNLGSLEAARRINGAPKPAPALKPKEVAAMVGAVDRETGAPLVAHPEQLVGGVQVGPLMVYVVKVGGQEVRRTVYQDVAVRTARAKRAQGLDVHLFQVAAA